MISFSTPYFDSECLKHIEIASINNVSYINKCEMLLNIKYNFPHSILTTSCTHALEMMAMILNIGVGDEVLIPSFTFVSTANAFVKFGADIKCIDSCNDHPNIDPNKLEKAITNKTKAVVIVHYGGWSCDMDKIVEICKRKNIFLLEDAAQAINTYYKNKALGTFGILSTFSFHSTKNINCGEGGLLVINDKNLIDKAHIIRDKGTNRYEFSKGNISKYEWVDKGSSYPLANINAAYLYPQLINIDKIIDNRKQIWKYYKKNLTFIEEKKIGTLSDEIEYCIGNYHIFYIIFNDEFELKKIQKYLKKHNIPAYTHYIPLHESKYYKEHFPSITLKNAELFGTNLLRLPLHNELTIKDTSKICRLIEDYYDYHIENIYSKNLLEKHIEEIIHLKSQFWKYNYESQKVWIQNNIKREDNHILLYKKNKLIGYGVIMNRNCKIIDSIIIDKTNRGFGYGGELIKYITKYIKSQGFLLCEKHNINYYKKYGWIIDSTLQVFNKNIKQNLYKMKFKLTNINKIYY